MDASPLERPYPELPSSVGKRVKCVDPMGGTTFAVIADEVRCFQDEKRSKIIVLQRMSFQDGGKIEVRLGYYIIGKKQKMKGRWVWGQYATILPAACLSNLYKVAEQRGWFA